MKFANVFKYCTNLFLGVRLHNLLLQATVFFTFLRNTNFSYLRLVNQKLGRRLVWISLISTVFLSLSFSPYSQAQSKLPVCNEDPCPDEGTTVWWHTYNHIHPLFPNCNFWVETFVKTCPNGDVLCKLNTYGFENVDGVITPECAALKAYLASHPSEFQMIFETLVDRVASRTFADRLFLHPEDRNLYCPNGLITICSYIPKCQIYCIYDDLRSIETGGTGMTYIVPKDCGSVGCCKVKHVICFDEATQTVIDTKTITPIGLPNVPCNQFTLCPLTYSIQIPGSSGSTYDVPLSGSSGCLPASCNLNNP